MDVLLGKVRTKDFRVDADALRRSHLLITGVSGSGKSYRLRCLAETLQPIMPVLIFDPEGEYYTLREKFPFVLFGEDGDAPLAVATAGLLALKILEYKFSAILDLSSLEVLEQHEWMAAFLAAIMRAPKHLWGPFAFLLDEAHIFCPEQGEEGSIALNHVKNLCSRGRKRGFFVCLSTQRLTKLSKSCASEMQNVMVGRTTLAADRERAAKQLGIITKEKPGFFQQIKTLKDHFFYGQGIAIAADLTLISPLTAQTTHIRPGEIGGVAPATPEMVKAFLPSLIGIGQEAKEEANTLEELRARVAALKAENMTLKANPPAPIIAAERTAADLANIAAAPGAVIEVVPRPDAKLENSLRGLMQEIVEQRYWLDDLISRFPDSGLTFDPAILPSTRPVLAPVQEIPVPAPPPALDLPPLQFSIMKALATCRAQGMKSIPRRWLAVLVGYSPKASTINTALKQLLDAGWVEYPARFEVGLGPKTESLPGAVIPINPDPVTLNDVMMQIQRAMDKPDAAIIIALMRAIDVEKSREWLAEQVQQSATSSTFLKRLTALRKLGFIDYTAGGVRVDLGWFRAARLSVAV